MRETRRDFLGKTVGGAALGAAGFYLAACGSGSSDSSTDTQVDVLYDWTYVGPPGTVASYWNQVRSRASSTKASGTIGELTEVPVENLFQTVDAHARAKSGPTVFTYFSDFVTYIQKELGTIKALDDYVPDNERSHWLLASAQADDNYWGAPQTLEVALLVINRRHFDKAGIDVDNQFESYDAFIEACDRLKAAGITPIEIGTSDGLAAEKWLMFEQLQVCESPATGPRIVVGELPIDDPFFARPRERLPVLRDEYMTPNPQQYTETMAVNKFMQQGSAGMMLMYSHPIFAPDAGKEYEVVGFPRSDAKFNRPALGTGDPLLITSYGENPEGAGGLIEFLHQPDQVDLWWQLTRSLPADDRLDSKQLEPAPKAIWDFVLERPDDLYSLWWPDNFYPIAPALTYTYSLQQDLFSSQKTPDEVRTATDELFTKWREDHPADVETVKSYIGVIDQLVAQSE